LHTPCAAIERDVRRRYVLAFDASQHRPLVTVAVSSHLMPVFHRKLCARKMGLRNTPLPDLRSYENSMQRSLFLIG
jgi:hypothetical protein